MTQFKLIKETNHPHGFDEKTYEVQKMQSIKESAMAYTPKQTKNIADLDKVDVNMTLEDREGTDSKGEVFKYKVVVIDNEEYRVPGKVIGDLKAILETKADLTLFKVNKTGTGMNTQYTVIPLG